jgi:hypothetical protein
MRDGRSGDSWLYLSDISWTDATATSLPTCHLIMLGSRRVTNTRTCQARNPSVSLIMRCSQWTPGPSTGARCSSRNRSCVYLPLPLTCLTAQHGSALLYPRRVNYILLERSCAVRPQQQPPPPSPRRLRPNRTAQRCIASLYVMVSKHRRITVLPHSCSRLSALVRCPHREHRHVSVRWHGMCELYRGGCGMCAVPESSEHGWDKAMNSREDRIDRLVRVGLEGAPQVLCVLLLILWVSSGGTVECVI